MTPEHREFNEYVDYALTLGIHETWMDCAAGDHDLFLVDDSFDHEYGTEQAYSLACKHCDHVEPYDGRFDFEDEGWVESDLWWGIEPHE